VHDPSKVAVCTAWLAGSCSSGDKCKRQHKVIHFNCQLLVCLTEHSPLHAATTPGYLV